MMNMINYYVNIVFNKPEELDLKVIYTPHSWINPVVRLLKKKDYAFNLVDSQSTMDGDFPTVIPKSRRKRSIKIVKNWY